MKFEHPNIVAEDAPKLAQFYISVFDCRQRGKETMLIGDWVEKGTGVKGAEIKSIILIMPGYEKDGPTLEVFQYNNVVDSQEIPLANRRGIGHLAFSTDDVTRTVENALEHGGKMLGEIAQKEFTHGTLTFTYITDPENNIIEVQNWQAK